MTKKKIVIGLTGNFGTGKSTVAGMFRKWGAQVVDADRLAHEVFKKESPLYSRLNSLFPRLKGKLTRKKVAEIVFGDLEQKKALESLIHPYVFKRIEEKLGQMRKEVAVVEVPLLFETGFDESCDMTVLVQAPRQKIIRRLKARGFEKSEAQRRWQVQMPAEEKSGRADFLIDNSDGRKKTEEQVKKIWEQVRKIQKGANRYNGKRESE